MDRFITVEFALTRAVTGLFVCTLRDADALREAVAAPLLTTFCVRALRFVVVRAVVEREDATARDDAFVRDDAAFDADDIARDADVERFIFVLCATFLFVFPPWSVDWTTLSSSFIASSVYSITSS